MEAASNRRAQINGRRRTSAHPITYRLSRFGTEPGLQTHSQSFLPIPTVSIPTMSPSRANPPSLTCSTCGRQYLLDETDSPPFCSERCKMIDLGRWLDEEIGMPHEGGADDGTSIETDSDQ